MTLEQKEEHEVEKVKYHSLYSLLHPNLNASIVKEKQEITTQNHPTMGDSEETKTSFRVLENLSSAKK